MGRDCVLEVLLLGSFLGTCQRLVLQTPKKQSCTIVSGDISQVIISLHLAFLVMFLSESGTFLKYSFNAGNCFLTLSSAGIKESHHDCTCHKKANLSRFSFCCTSV